MSSRARKLLKKIQLKDVRIGNNAKHGCAQCRDKSARTKHVRRATLRGQISDPPSFVCAACKASWRVTFGADMHGNAIVMFQPEVLS